MRPSHQLIRLLVSLTFIFSGFMKLNDPTGFSFKLAAYFQAFAVDFTPLFLKCLPLTTALAIGISTLEIVLGTALLVNLYLRHTLRMLLLLTGFFSLLTFYTAAFKRLGSCGCFGDAIPLTPWQSCLKSLLLLLALGLLYQRQAIHKKANALIIQLGIPVFAGILGISMGWYTLHHLPIIDFSPYKVGNNLGVLSKPSAPLRYQYWLEKDNKQLKTLIYPKDTTYRLIKTILLNPANKPQLSNFTIWNKQEEITTQVLQGTKLLVIIKHPAALSHTTFDALATFLQMLPARVQPLWLMPFHAHTEHVPGTLAMPFAWASADLLNAMLPANLGFILLQDGIVVGKWAYQDLVQVKKALAKHGLYQ